MTHTRQDKRGNMIEYPLTFHEALDYLQDDAGWIQGEDFADGLVLKWGNEGFLTIYDFLDHDEYDFCITKHLMNMRYRLVYTQPDACRNV